MSGDELPFIDKQQQFLRSMMMEVMSSVVKEALQAKKEKKSDGSNYLPSKDPKKSRVAIVQCRI